jgi:hypothetical protein
MKYRIALALLVFLFVACDSSTGPGGGGKVAIRFSTTTSAGVSATMLAPENPALNTDQLTVTGTNGTLVIDDIRFIVSEMELESSGTNCVEDEHDDDGDDDIDDVDDRDDDGDDDDDDCEFEGGPFIVDLPLEGDAAITTQNVPPGTYNAFKFEVEDLEVDDDDDKEEKSNIPAILAEMRSVYPDFPSRASMVVKGTQNGQPFIVYFRSDFEIEQRIEPPLVVPQDNSLSVNLDPALWFKNGTQIVNLLALNGKLVDFGSAFRGGFTGTHRGDDDD